MLKRFFSRRQAGDTIVEVLIVLAIVGLALGISYATANRSLLTVQQSQEHAQALQLVQGQLEQLKSDLSDPTNPDVAIIKGYTSPGGYKAFCYDVSGVLQISSSATDPTCQQGSAPYNITITCGNNGNPCKDVYVAEAHWDSIQGNGHQDDVSVAYKVYAP